MNIHRPIYLQKLIDRRHNGMIKIITGMRRSGKSYLLFNLFACQKPTTRSSKSAKPSTRNYNRQAPGANTSGASFTFSHKNVSKMQINFEGTDTATPSHLEI